MDFESVIVSVSPHEPAVWIATPIAAIAYGLAVFLISRVIWSGARTRTDRLLRSVGSFALLVGLVIPFAGLHGFLMSFAFTLLHGGSFGSTMVCTLFAPWSRILLLLGGLCGFVATLIVNLRRARLSPTPA